MTPADLQALRVAIALSDGWREKWKGEGYYGHPESKVDCRADGLDNSFQLPSYTTSRDAIVAAVLQRFRTRDGMEKFILALATKIFGTRALSWKVEDNIQAFALATADALTLCKAYCAAAGISVEGA